MAISLTVNGRAVLVDVPDDMPLLWVLREQLELVGAKFGCGLGQCGACTVLLNGRAVRSCNLPASRAAGASITTIEGLSPSGDHPLQRAWVEHDVAQCGYCQSGQLLAASALLARSPNPSDAEIAASMNANLCRCATYPRIREAIRAAAQAQVKGGTPSDREGSV